MKEVTFRAATESDALYIADRLREADIAEVGALGASPRQAMLLSLTESDEAYTALVDGEPAMMFGCQQPLMSEAALVWALGTDLCTRSPRQMLEYGRQKIAELRERYPVMHNHCDARYKAAHRWLRRLGFHVGDPKPFGQNGELFCKITIGGKECV